METTQKQTEIAEDQPTTGAPEATAAMPASLYHQVYSEAEIKEVIKRNAQLMHNYDALSKKVDALTRQTSEGLTQAIVQAICTITDDVPGRKNNQPTESLKKRLDVLRTNYPNTLI